MSLHVDGLAVRYGARTAVQPCTFTLRSGLLVALVGPNGAGKSSLLKALAGVVPSAGSIDWRGAAPARSARGRARAFAYLPQSPAAHWPLAVRDLVALGRLPHRAFGERPNDADREAVDWAMERADVAAFAERAVDELSGGEHARVQLARALAVRAPVLLADEPAASLDPHHQLRIMRVLIDYAQRDALVVAVMHDLTLAARFAARVILMHEGAVVADGAPTDVLDARKLREYYRVEPYLAEHEGQPVVVPWRTLG